MWGTAMCAKSAPCNTAWFNTPYTAPRGQRCRGGPARAPPLLSPLSRAAKLEKLEAPEEQDANLVEFSHTADTQRKSEDDVGQNLLPSYRLPAPTSSCAATLPAPRSAGAEEELVVQDAC